MNTDTKNNITPDELAFVEHYLYNLMLPNFDNPALRWTAKTGTTCPDIGLVLEEGERMLRAEGREPLFDEPTRLYAEPWASREEAMARNAELASEVEALKERKRA